MSDEVRTMEEDYYSNKFALDPDHRCPLCGAKPGDLLWGEPEQPGDDWKVYQTVNCGFCKMDWLAVYEITGLEYLKAEELV